MKDLPSLRTSNLALPWMALPSLLSPATSTHEHGLDVLTVRMQTPRDLQEARALLVELSSVTTGPKPWSSCSTDLETRSSLGSGRPCPGVCAHTTSVAAGFLCRQECNCICEHSSHHQHLEMFFLWNPEACSIV